MFGHPVIFSGLRWFLYMCIFFLSNFTQQFYFTLFSTLFISNIKVYKNQRMFVLSSQPESYIRLSAICWQFFRTFVIITPDISLRDFYSSYFSFFTSFNQRRMSACVSWPIYILFISIYCLRYRSFQFCTYFYKSFTFCFRISMYSLSVSAC